MEDVGTANPLSASGTTAGKKWSAAMKQDVGGGPGRRRGGRLDVSQLN
jgi:hypothetical protein